MDSQQNTTGLEDRIAKLATATELPDFPDDKSDLPSDFEYNPEDYEEEEEVEEITEAELLKYLDSQEKALNVCQRLFYHELNTTKSQENSSSWNLKCLSAEAIEELYAQGWTELEGTMIDLDILKGAHNEAKKLLDDGKFAKADALKDEDDPFRDASARDDIIVWLGDDQTIKTPPNLEKILTVLKTSLCSELSSMIRLNGHNEFQLDYYHPNGAHYERHRDALPTDDPMDGTQRRITIIVYLNTDWVSGHGGEVKLYSQLDDHGLQEGADRISKPQLGKVLIMLSGVMDYEVMPTKDKERFALTCWLR